MKSPRRSKALLYALYANALVLGLIALLLWRRPMLPAALADEPTPHLPLAGGGGIYIMPCQLHPNVWGCYLMDNDRQTLCVYEYQAGTKELKLTAARFFRYDLQLRDLDTTPAWDSIKKLVEEQDKSNLPGNAPGNPGSPEIPAPGR